MFLRFRQWGGSTVCRRATPGADSEIGATLRRPRCARRVIAEIRSAPPWERVARYGRNGLVIVMSDATSLAYHEARFAALCTRLRGRVRRCYISFVTRYGKVQRNFRQFEQSRGLAIQDPPLADRVGLARRLAEIAATAGIETYSCCGDYLVGGAIRKAHCIDGDILSRLYFGGRWQGVEKPTRKECGCTESTDIGAYDTCPHGCIYCYANVNKQRAVQAWQRHDPASPFLGMSAVEAERCLATLRRDEAAGRREAGTQMSLDI